LISVFSNDRRLAAFELNFSISIFHRAVIDSGKHIPEMTSSSREEKSWMEKVSHVSCSLKIESVLLF
jgi:hypothetical protein